MHGITGTEIPFPFSIAAAFTLIGLLSWALYFLIPFSSPPMERLKTWWGAHFGLLFYTSSIVFGLVHMMNYTTADGSYELNNPLFFVPQIISGLCLGYVRSSNGIFYSILLHSIMNGLPMLVMLLRHIF